MAVDRGDEGRPGARLLRAHGPLGDWPHAAGTLSLNPLYERDGDRHVLRLPSPWYETENGRLREYVPPTVGREATPELVARAAFVGLPERYARPARPRVARADRALTRAVHRLRA